MQTVQLRVLKLMAVEARVMWLGVGLEGDVYSVVGMKVCKIELKGQKSEWRSSKYRWTGWNEDENVSTEQILGQATKISTSYSGKRQIFETTSNINPIWRIIVQFIKISINSTDAANDLIPTLSKALSHSTFYQTDSFPADKTLQNLFKWNFSS